MVVPVVAIVGYWGFAGERLRTVAGVAWSGDPQARLYASARREALAKAVNMDVAQFVTELRQQRLHHGTVPEGLSEADIQSVEGRLGVRLPEDVRAVYRVSNGVGLLRLAPLDQATRPDAYFLAGITAAARDGEVEISREVSGRVRPVYASVEQLTHTVRLGWEPGRSYSGVLVDLNQPSLVGGHSLILAYGTPDHVFLTAMDVRDRLQKFWVTLQAQAAVNQRYARELATQVEALQGEDVPRRCWRIFPSLDSWCARSFMCRHRGCRSRPAPRSWQLPSAGWGNHGRRNGARFCCVTMAIPGCFYYPCRVTFP